MITTSLDTGQESGSAQRKNRKKHRGTSTRRCNVCSDSFTFCSQEWRGAGVCDTCCNRTVAGQEWMITSNPCRNHALPRWPLPCSESRLRPQEPFWCFFLSGQSESRARNLMLPLLPGDTWTSPGRCDAKGWPGTWSASSACACLEVPPASVVSRFRTSGGH